MHKRILLNPGHHLLPALMFAGWILALASPASAQRNGNVWDGKSHQPTAGAVQSGERSAGVQPAPGREQALDQEVDQTARRLLRNEPGVPTETAPRAP